MKKNERRAIVWDTIAHTAFRPVSPEKWLGVYAKTLHTLWGIEPMWARLGIDDHFDIHFLLLKCNYLIESATKYSVSLTQNSPTVHCYWQNHIDSEYLSKGALYSASGQYPSQQRAQLQRDIEAVLNGMIFHPRCHTHLEDLGRQVQLDQDRGGLSSHEVRIGGGIENPYVFLFHLRYQFCLVSNKVRQTERQRLVDLFESSIRNNQNVNAKDLFNFKHRKNLVLS
ncbi:MAG: hypothetical protein JRE64_00975 [Deltaproteobacteria bacterium]|nr:hypothetical protein [Deltaproteobacteria bacterium]